MKRSTAAIVFLIIGIALAAIGAYMVYDYLDNLGFMTILALILSPDLIWIVLVGLEILKGVQTELLLIGCGIAACVIGFIIVVTD